MTRSTLTSKGQITVPIEIRERFGLDKGDVLDFDVDDNGSITVRVLDQHDLGVLRDFAPQTPVTVDEMNQAVRDRATAKVHR